MKHHEIAELVRAKFDLIELDAEIARVTQDSDVGCCVGTDPAAGRCSRKSGADAARDAGQSLGVSRANSGSSLRR